ncbi:hypothetical protein OAF34_06560 [Pirellulaceae bacterium]|nr:hypothetical protein [Pirellulaceae bacterium]
MNFLRDGYVNARNRIWSSTRDCFQADAVKPYSTRDESDDVSAFFAVL